MIRSPHLPPLRRTPVGHARLRRAGGLRAAARRLRRSTSGLALIEFALSLPPMLALGVYGLETTNYALTQLKVSQIALNLADTASRTGVGAQLSMSQLREFDVNDILQGVRIQGQGIQLTTQGRIILSSLENIQQSYDTAGPVQRIHWQRCLGKQSGPGYDSSYGSTSTAAGSDNKVGNAGITVPNGIGDNPASMVTAPAGAGVMFVEINYQYKPLITSFFLGTPRIHYIASFIVRDRRDFSQLFNPPPAAAQSTCDKYTA